MRVGSVIVAAVAALALAAPAGAARLTQADRAGITQTLDKFVATAVKRHDVAASYDLVTPELRNGMTRAEWAKGDIPVYPYNARGRAFHAWTLSYIYGKEVGVTLMLRPRDLRQDTFAFDVTMKKIHGRWLVDLFMPAATFSNTERPRVVGPHDFLAASGANETGERRLGAVWIAVPAAVVGLGLIVALGILLAGLRRNRSEPVPAAERERYQEFAERVHKRTATRAYSQRL
jgi:hypothetical protein